MQLNPAKLKIRLATPFLFLFIFIFVTDINANEPSVKNDIEINGGCITGEITEKRIVNILEAIGKIADFKPVFMGKFDNPITLSFKNEPIPKAIHRIAGNNSVAILYKSSEKSTENSDKPTISEVWLFETEISTSMKNTTGNNTGIIEAADSDISIALENASKNIHYNSSESNKKTDILHWVEILRQSRDFNMQKRAIEELKWIGSNDSLSAMAGALGSDNADLRCFVVKNIAAVDSDLSTRLLGQVLFGDTADKVRREAAKELSNQGSDISFSMLKNALKDTDKEVREIIQTALGSNQILD